jgi:hypothetical protein
MRLPALPLRHLLSVAGACLFMFAGAVLRLEAQSDDASEGNREYTVKAAYLLQFGRYAQWPANSFANNQSPLVIGVLGKYPFSTDFEEVARTKRIEGRPVVIRQFASMTEYKTCHILFIVASFGTEETAAAIKELKNTSVLLVGEKPGFAEQGGLINFYVEERKVRFEINVEVARQKQLKIDSTLLSLAKIVGRS